MKYITKYNINVILSNIPFLMILILILLKKYSLVSGLIITTICCQLVKKLTNFLPKESIIYRITRRPEMDYIAE